MYRLLLLLLSSQCVAAHCVACHATVRCCPSCHPSHRCAVLPLVLPSSGCVLGCGVLPVSPLPCCPLRVRPWCVAHIAAAATLPVVLPLSACQAAVCYPRRCHRRAAPCVSGHGVLPALPPPLCCPSCRHQVAACRAAVCCLRRRHHRAAHCVAVRRLHAAVCCCPHCRRCHAALHVAVR